SERTASLRAQPARSHAENGRRGGRPILPELGSGRTGVFVRSAPARARGGRPPPPPGARFPLPPPKRGTLPCPDTPQPLLAERPEALTGETRFPRRCRSEARSARYTAASGDHPIAPGGRGHRSRPPRVPGRQTAPNDPGRGYVPCDQHRLLPSERNKGGGRRG